MSEYQVLTPGQVVDWKLGLSHLHLDVSYLLTDKGERIPIEDLTPDIIFDSRYFIAGEEELSVTPSQIVDVMNLAYNCGKDGMERGKMCEVVEKQLSYLGFGDFELPKEGE